MQAPDLRNTPEQVCTFHFAFGVFCRASYIPDGGPLTEVSFYRDATTAQAADACGILAEDCQAKLTAAQLTAIGVRVSMHEQSLARQSRSKLTDAQYRQIFSVANVKVPA